VEPGGRAALAGRASSIRLVASDTGWGQGRTLGALSPVIDALRTRGRDRAHSFVIGGAGVVRSLQVMGTCARAQPDRFLM